MPFTHRLRVRFGECDPQNIVFNAHYLAYADIALTEMQREAFGSYAQMVETFGVDFVVAEATVRFRAPARFDDLVDVTLEVVNLGTTSMTTRFAMSRAGEQLVDGELRHVFVDAASWAKTPIPDGLREALGAFAA